MVFWADSPFWCLRNQGPPSKRAAKGMVSDSHCAQLQLSKKNMSANQLGDTTSTNTDKVVQALI